MIMIVRTEIGSNPHTWRIDCGDTDELAEPSLASWNFGAR